MKEEKKNLSFISSIHIIYDNTSTRRRGKMKRTTQESRRKFRKLSHLFFYLSLHLMLSSFVNVIFTQRYLVIFFACFVSISISCISNFLSQIFNSTRNFSSQPTSSVPMSHWINFELNENENSSLTCRKVESESLHYSTFLNMFMLNIFLLLLRFVGLSLKIME
jgi:hypothetical protein